MISMAKADLLKDAELQKLLAKYGVTGLIDKSAFLSFSDGRTGNFNVTIQDATLVPGQKVALLVYVPGNNKPKVIKASWKNGKLSAKLPIPCNYSVIK